MLFWITWWVILNWIFNQIYDNTQWTFMDEKSILALLIILEISIIKLSSAAFNSDQHIQRLSSSGWSTVWFNLTYFLIWNQMIFSCLALVIYMIYNWPQYQLKYGKYLSKIPKTGYWQIIWLNMVQNFM